MSVDTGNPLLDALLGHLVAEGVGVAGTDLFVHFMPEGVSRGLVLLDNFVMKTTEAGIPGYRRSQFRIIVRESTYKAGNDLSNAAIAKLNMARVTLPGVEIKICEATHDPVAFAPSTNTRAREFVTNFSVIYGLL
jgi:hypothetical protein